MRDLLLPFTRCHARPASFEYAAWLSAQFDAPLTALYLVQPFLGGPAFDSPAAIADAIDYLLQQRRAAGEGGTAFAEWARSRGLDGFRWQSAEAPFAATIAAAADWHDLVVLEADESNECMDVAALGQIVLTSRRPCLIVRSDAVFAPPRRIAVAWNASAECIRALRSALGLLLRADEVVLLGDAAPGRRRGSVEPPGGIAGYLRGKGVPLAVSRQRIDPDDAGASLAQAAAAAGADLLVMGAYGHNRFSEWMLGGATRYLLQHCPLPLFLQH
ncbi:universal stress protein [Tahibacter harae]|uniref:Universal stress protein n=1 Tax=Tahibacter harae TaxID=2963937 RepID=A0ABT1QNC7_9GAMM|nr:universal stress protein [Tahibacter harae]MCQ4163550.1 universal stress protein [Tahibacter harae]